MIVRQCTTLLALGGLMLGMAFAKPKKEKISAVFQNARIVYVQSVDGDALDTRLYPEDRAAIFDVQERLRDWHRYTITLRREDADLVFMVRKGRAAAAKTRTGISIGQPVPGGSYPGRSPGQSPGQYPGQGTPQPGSGTQMGASAEIGPAEDMLRIFAANQDGKLIGPIWSRELDGGLDAPSVELVQELQAAVEEAYPQPPPKSKPAGQSPTQPQAQPQDQSQAQPQAQPQDQPQAQPQPQAPPQL